MRDNYVKKFEFGKRARYAARRTLKWRLRVRMAGFIRGACYVRCMGHMVYTGCSENCFILK